MNRSKDLFGTGEVNQIEALSKLGYFESSPTEPVKDIYAFPSIGDSDLSVEERARVYLDVNCSNCHRPDTATQGNMDLRREVALSEMGICDAVPEQGDVGGEGARLLKPGTPDESVLWLRMSSTDLDIRMPAIGSGVVDDEAAELLFEWISALSSCGGP